MAILYLSRSLEFVRYFLLLHFIIILSLSIDALHLAAFQSQLWVIPRHDMHLLNSNSEQVRENL